MGQGFLQVIRGCLILLALATIIMAAQFVRIYQIQISDSKQWHRWMPLILAILSVIVFSWILGAQSAQKSFSRSNGARYICSLLLCAAWLVSPIYMIIIILDLLRPYALEDQFFEYWYCRIEPSCKYGFATDVCSFLMALFVLLEAISVYLYGLSRKARKAGALPTTVMVGSGLQQYPAQPVHYVPVQQVMTVPYQSR
ncbi:MAG: hypothetical protein J3Q66DRAFT_347621 [Benniella sp.]|nr:MAG: hypothetical protein J3Q66DRAFT_347621 [Benniella sp.]